MTRSSVFRPARLLGGALLCAALCGCGVTPKAARHLDPQWPWFADNRERIDALLDKHAGAAQPRPVAVFDWDNTVIKNDVGDITIFWMLRHDQVLQPPDRNWAVTSPFLTGAAQQALSLACGPLAEPGQPLPTAQPQGLACADEIMAVYGKAATGAGAPAFAGWNHRTMEPAYAWNVALHAGHTPAEIKGFAAAAIAEALKVEVGAVQSVGSRADTNAYVRIYEPIRDLIGALQADEFEVWVLSASAQPVVEAFAAQVGVPAERVIGIRAIVGADGKLTRALEGCGAVADGANTLITYVEGKRCWMNKVIFGVQGAAAAAVQTDPAKRPVFAAGDSNTDVAFLQDATGLKLVLNRHKSELMCNAYHNVGGNWLINPMFIAPQERQADRYPCSTSACTDATGAGVACKDERGGPIPDQPDTVF